MNRKTDPADVEPHVFDQTNGLVDLSERAAPADVGRDNTRDQTVAGIAMLSANRPAG